MMSKEKQQSLIEESDRMIAYIHSRINPQYEFTIGTESYDLRRFMETIGLLKRALVEQVDGLGNAQLSIEEQLEAIREIEIDWLSDWLGKSIANLGYPVGLGMAPNPEQLRRAGTAIFERFAAMAQALESARAEGSA